MRNRVPRSQVPIGAEWLNSMPTGDGWFPQRGGQPVVEVQFRRCRPNVQVVEYLYASIQRRHLGRGTATNAQVRRWVQTVVGRRNDDAGHIIGRNQGGLGTVEWNIFPQNGNFNRGAYSREVERLINDAVRAGEDLVPLCVWQPPGAVPPYVFQFLHHFQQWLHPPQRPP